MVRILKINAIGFWKRNSGAGRCCGFKSHHEAEGPVPGLPGHWALVL